MSRSQYQIINTFYQKEAAQLSKDILIHYEQHRTGIINYIYGFQLVKHKLLEEGTNYSIKNKTYYTKEMLLDSSFLLPDGAAIRTMWLVGKLLERWK